uniref:Uncharacterized protein n=1 Tax=Ciona savignyi TaxID=51511 RepID=H2YX52_CIOSA
MVDTARMSSDTGSSFNGSDISGGRNEEVESIYLSHSVRDVNVCHRSKAAVSRRGSKSRHPCFSLHFAWALATTFLLVVMFSVGVIKYIQLSEEMEQTKKELVSLQFELDDLRASESSHPGDFSQLISDNILKNDVLGEFVTPRERRGVTAPPQNANNHGAAQNLQIHP